MNEDRSDRQRKVGKVKLKEMVREEVGIHFWWLVGEKGNDSPSSHQ